MVTRIEDMPRKQIGYRGRWIEVRYSDWSEGVVVSCGQHSKTLTPKNDFMMHGPSIMDRILRRSFTDRVQRAVNEIRLKIDIDEMGLGELPPIAKAIEEVK